MDDPQQSAANLAASLISIIRYVLTVQIYFEPFQKECIEMFM